MALGLVRSTVELLTRGRGITPVRGFHQLTCPLLYRLALVLVFGLCTWKWTSSVTTLDPNQSCSIGFDGSASGIAQSLVCTRKLGKCRSSEGLRSFNPSKGTNLLILIILAGDIHHICINSLVPSVMKINIGNPGIQVNYWGGLTPPPH